MTIWFERNQFGSPSPLKLQSLFFNLQKFREDPIGNFDYRDLQERRVMGYSLPVFQRDAVWTEEQKIRFIDSARRCVPLGTYTLNETFNVTRGQIDANGREFYFGDGWLLDGQQRLRALEDFFSDRLRVHGSIWSELSEDTQHQFLFTQIFPCYETSFTTLEQCENYYDLMNFSGTPHQESERAVKK